MMELRHLKVDVVALPSELAAVVAPQTNMIPRLPVGTPPYTNLPTHGRLFYPCCVGSLMAVWGISIGCSLTLMMPRVIQGVITAGNSC